MTKTLEMVFRNEAGNEVSVQLADPKDALTLAKVQTAMNSIIAKTFSPPKAATLSPSLMRRFASATPARLHREGGANYEAR